MARRGLKTPAGFFVSPTTGVDNVLSLLGDWQADSLKLDPDYYQLCQVICWSIVIAWL